MQTEASLTWDSRRVADLNPQEQGALQNLSQAVYPPAIAATWPGRAIRWSPHQWCVVGWGALKTAICYVGVVIRDARFGNCAVRVGGIGGVKTHPAFRGQGHASAAIHRAVEFFHHQGNVDFGLLVCNLDLVRFYERLGWSTFPGDLLVAQNQATVLFTFNQVMTIPIRSQEPLTGEIDLLGLPW